MPYRVDIWGGECHMTFLKRYTFDFTKEEELRNMIRLIIDKLNEGLLINIINENSILNNYIER